MHFVCFDVSDFGLFAVAILCCCLAVCVFGVGVYFACAVVWVLGFVFVLFWGFCLCAYALFACLMIRVWIFWVVVGCCGCVVWILLCGDFAAFL